jgi:hypothetical protein
MHSAALNDRTTPPTVPPLAPTCRDLVSEVSAQLAARDPASSLHYTLVPDDATHIVYETGGFFKPHRDFTSVVSNVVEEYTLLVCVTAPGPVATTGGETRITLSSGRSIVSTATVTPGCALVSTRTPHRLTAWTPGPVKRVCLSVVSSWC